MTISLTNITLRARHGVFPTEREHDNTFRVSVRVTMPNTLGIASDQLEDTVNYQTIYKVVKHEMAIPSNLLEHVAGRIVKAVHQVIPQAQEVEVEVQKKNPPLGGDVEWAGVTVNSLEFRV